MTETKWTPGPWRVFDRMQTNEMPVDGTDNGLGKWLHSCRHIADRGETLIGHVESNDGNKGGFPTVQSSEEMLANADLIATAPELYDALYDATMALYVVNRMYKRIDPKMLTHLKSVLAKARGAQQ